MSSNTNESVNKDMENREFPQQQTKVSNENTISTDIKNKEGQPQASQSLNIKSRYDSRGAPIFKQRQESCL